MLEIFPVSKLSTMCWAIINACAVQDLPGRKLALSGIKTCSILNWRQAVQYQAFVQFVEVTQMIDIYLRYSANVLVSLTCSDRVFWGRRYVTMRKGAQ